MTILRKRERYRVAFDGFDPRKVSRYGPRQVARLLGDEGIVRNSSPLREMVHLDSSARRIFKSSLRTGGL